MFWRFGFHNACAIDSLLDKEDVALESILDEEELLQECKNQNTRLIDYFQRVDVLQRLFAYVSGNMEADEKSYRYPYVATEVLCSEIWSIVETCINEQQQLLTPFWESVLDRPSDDMKTHMVMATNFAKVNSVFLSKKPVEMLEFIKAQPNIIERLLTHIETPPFVDVLVRIVQLDEQPSCAGVIDWLSSQSLIPRLIDLLAPTQSLDIHAVVCDLIKAIISMANPGPGAGRVDGPHFLPASNLFVRELARPDSMTKLMDYITRDFRKELPPEDEEDTLPSLASSTSSVIHAILVIIELIRKNNSDYLEQYLFHTLRNRLMQVQQQWTTDPEKVRPEMERALKEIVDRLGMVHMGPLLDISCERLEVLQRYLREPRSLTGMLATTVGNIKPLTQERQRIIELCAELLHASNLALVNRRGDREQQLYDENGCLRDGLQGLEELSKILAQNATEREQKVNGNGTDTISPSGGSRSHHSSTDSDDDMSSDDDTVNSDDVMEEIVMDDEASRPALDEDPTASPTVSVSHLKRSSRTINMGMLHAPPPPPVTVGERVKRKWLDLGMLSTLLDLFFEYPWNNFLHSSVYDIIHQILTGPMAAPLNREIVVSLFRDARIMHRIVQGQKDNDVAAGKPKGVRLGYMGHLTLIAEDVIMALERFPPEMKLTVIEYAPVPDWDEYVTGRYHETKKKDTALLGGGKPAVVARIPGNASRWKVDEEDLGPMNGKPIGEFRRTTSIQPPPQTADFGPAPMGDDNANDSDSDEDADHEASVPQFARYLASEMNPRGHFGSSESDEEEEEPGWLSQSTFINKPPVSSRQQRERRPLDASGFDDAFNPTPATATSNPFAHDDDAFGAFAEAETASGADPFTFSTSTSYSEDMDVEDGFSDSFGDFGDFQSASNSFEQDTDSELTPTSGSWTFATGSGTSENGEPTSPFSLPENKRTP
ncbi:SAPS-domain-containing protein [Fistulina hepatica ATCC 64428]|uniref:SAPS-domain-containing protein n=1 Tax=Fistulina hepatica ATCC 64428 TaxID=1128425 RepID=A0A0D7A894_9AGAR|nr:SAPS-domain-containing protein [Fistulina hepatica ATCC 64428]